MAQRTRGSQGRRVALAAAMLAAPVLAATAQASVVLAAPARTSAVLAATAQAPAVLAPARSPAGSARALAALARFANGQLGDSAYDRRVAAALGKMAGARATAKRIVAAYEAMSPADRGAVFGGVDGVEKLTINAFDRARYDRYRLEHADGLAKRADRSLANRTVLAPDPVDPGKRGQYELIYRGMKVLRSADADGVDEPVVFTAVLTPGPPDDPYRTATRTLPDTGTLGVANGASSAASAGPVWASPVWPGASNSGVVLLTAVIEDNGDLGQRKQELGLLIELAKSEASEDNNPDRALVLRRELEDAVDLLHLASHQVWDPRAVQVRLIGAAEYEQLYQQPAEPSPFPHKLELSHGPRGGDYVLYFDVPAPSVHLKTVVVAIRQIEALGADRDAAENHLADLGVSVAIDAGTPASATRSFGGDKNLHKPQWRFERQVRAGSNVRIQLALWDLDPPPPWACTQPAGWPALTCHAACGEPPPCSPGAATPCPLLVGPCPPTRTDYDLDVRAEGDGWSDGDHTIDAIFDLGSNTLSGDIHGPAGSYTLAGTVGSPIRGRVVVEVSQK